MEPTSALGKWVYSFLGEKCLDLSLYCVVLSPSNISNRRSFNQVNLHYLEIHNIIHLMTNNKHIHQVDLLLLVVYIDIIPFHVWDVAQYRSNDICTINNFGN